MCRFSGSSFLLSELHSSGVGHKDSIFVPVPVFDIDRTQKGPQAQVFSYVPNFYLICEGTGIFEKGTLVAIHLTCFGILTDCRGFHSSHALRLTQWDICKM